MYAMLGDVRFEPLNGFTSLETEHTADFAKHDVLQGRPRLQAVGNGLTTMRFGLKLHWKLGNPDVAYNGLLAAKESQQAQALVYGSGHFAGWFVIERIGERTLVQDGQGRTAARELDVELTEFAGDPNNPLPTPGVMSGGKSPLSALLPESVRAQASDIAQAVEKGVRIYRTVEKEAGEVRRLIYAAKDIQNDPAAALNLLGDALNAGGSALDRLAVLPDTAAVFGRLPGAAEFAAQAGQAAAGLAGTVGILRAAREDGLAEGITAAIEAADGAAAALRDGAAAVETLAGTLAARRDL